MPGILSDLTVFEVGSFIAAPSCALHLAQLGAEVIRIDTVGGGPDAQRWPLAPSGRSLYWEGLNKGKKSVAINLSLAEGRELLTKLITIPGVNCGLVVTNLPAEGFLSYERLRTFRQDLIVLRIMGRADGRTAVDYTVNCGYGLPFMTGPACLDDDPVNHVLPAWDLLAGAYGAFTLLAAERHRRLTGVGQEIRVPLDDLAIANLGHLGQIAETTVHGRDRPRHGNDLYGAFGRDFTTADGRRIMIVAITPRQWSGLVQALDIADEIAAAEAATGVSFATDEGLRFLHRDALNPIVARAIGRLDHDTLAGRLESHGACWGPYRTLAEALREDASMSEANPMLTLMRHRSGASYLTPGAPASFSRIARMPPEAAPDLGDHTETILGRFLGLSKEDVAGMKARDVVTCPGAEHDAR